MFALASVKSSARPSASARKFAAPHESVRVNTSSIPPDIYLYDGANVVQDLSGTTPTASLLKTTNDLRLQHIPQSSFRFCALINSIPTAPTNSFLIFLQLKKPEGASSLSFRVPQATYAGITNRTTLLFASRTLRVRFSQAPSRWTAARSVQARPRSPRHSLRASQFDRGGSARRVDPFLALAGERL